MPSFDHTGRPPRERLSHLTRYSLKRMRPGVGLGADDTDGLVDAATAIDAAGGGELVIDAIITIASDVEVPRTVRLAGVHPAVSQIKGSAGQRRLGITGVPADAPSFDGDIWEARDLTFDAVSLILGPNVADVPRGERAVACEFVNSDYGLKIEGVNRGAFATVGAFRCKARLCDVGVLLSSVGPDHVIEACELSECAEASIKIDAGQPDGVSLFIRDTYSDHCRRFLKVVGTPTTDGGIYINGGGVELCGTSDTGAYADGYFIENEWANIWIEHLNGFSGPDTTACFWNKGGTIYVESGRMYWDAGKFARMDGGQIVFFQDKVFSPGKLWGDSQGAIATASSTGGRVYAPRAGYVARHNLNVTTLTSASPVQNIAYAQGYDGSDRVVEFDVTCNGIGATNTLRIQLADGVSTIRIDMAFPLVPGGGRCRLVHKCDVEWAASMIYAPLSSPTVATAAGNPPTKTEFDLAVAAINNQAIYVRQSVSASAVVANAKFLSLTTIGPSASQITISNLVETVSGPSLTGI